MIVFPSFASSNCGMLKTVRIVDDQVVYGFPLFGFTMKYMYCTLTSFITNEVYIHNVSYEGRLLPRRTQHPTSLSHAPYLPIHTRHTIPSFLTEGVEESTPFKSHNRRSWEGYIRQHVPTRAYYRRYHPDTSYNKYYNIVSTLCVSIRDPFRPSVH